MSLSASAFAGHQTYMDEEQESYLRDVLVSWKIRLFSGVNQTLLAMKQHREFFSEEVDIAAQEESFRLSLLERDRDRKLIRKIDEALALMNTGDYGYCEDCGGEIGFARLEARPIAAKCIECKTIAEVKEKQMVMAE